MISLDIIDQVIVRCLETGLLFSVGLISFLLPLDHLRPQLIDLSLQLALPLRGSLQSFDKVLDLLLLDRDVILESFVLPLDHTVLGV